MLGIGGGLTHISEHEQLYSVTFDGTGDIINLNDTFQATFKGDFSVSCWVNLSDSSPTTNQFIWGSNEGNTDKLYLAYLTSGNWYLWFEGDNDEATPINVSSGLSGNDPTGWHHVVIYANNVGASAHSTIALFVNGSYVTHSGSGITGANHTAFATTKNLYIGAYNNQDSVGLPITGKVSDFAIWDVALDADAIDVIYNSGKPFDLTSDRTTGAKVYDNASDLVSYYKMNDGSGTTVVDSMGNSNGTLVADAAFSTDTPDD